MRDYLLIVVVLLCAANAVRRPAFGMLTFICFSLLNPHSMTWGARHFPFAQLVALGTMTGYVFWSEPRRFPFERESLLLAVLWGWMAITTLFADHPVDARVFLIRVSKILLMVFLSMSIINTRRRLHILIRIIGLSLGFYGAKCGWFYLSSGGNQLVYGPEESFLWSNNSIGLALAMNIPFLYYLTRMESNVWLKRVLWGMLVLSIPAIIGTTSRGAWIGMAVAVGIIVLRSKHRVLLIVLGAILLTAIVPFLPQRTVSRYDDLVNWEEESSAISRFWNWRFATRVMLANPLFGAGFDYYGLDAYQRYFPEFMERWPGKIWSCHSIWFTMLSEHGVPGIILWVALLLSTFMSLRRIHKRALVDENAAWTLEYARLLEVTFLVFMIVGSFLDASYFDLFYQLVAVVVILKSLDEAPAVEPAAKPVPVRPRSLAGGPVTAER